MPQPRNAKYVRASTMGFLHVSNSHDLKKVQADPHPGNFLVSEKGELIALDFRVY